VVKGASHLNQRAATPIAGNKEAERLDDEDEDEGVGEEGDHDEEYRRQMEEVNVLHSNSSRHEILLNIT